MNINVKQEIDLLDLNFFGAGPSIANNLKNTEKTMEKKH